MKKRILCAGTDDTCGHTYILVTENESDDSEAMILKDVSDPNPRRQSMKKSWMPVNSMWWRKSFRKCLEMSI